MMRRILTSMQFCLTRTQGNQRVAITGFNATNGIGEIRIWAKSNLHRAPDVFCGLEFHKCEHEYRMAR